jgi:hypothetical protein
MKALLYAPESYWKLTPEQKSSIVNGCGPGKVLGILVPDSLWGLNITEVCNIHDYCYAMGESIKDKNEADRIFLNNMLRVIDAAQSCWLLRVLRARRAQTYYNAVRDFGGPFFWKGKNKLSEMRTVEV